MKKKINYKSFRKDITEIHSKNMNLKRLINLKQLVFNLPEKDANVLLEELLECEHTLNKKLKKAYELYRSRCGSG